MRVLLTGAEGYIGSLAGPLLADRGHDVVGLDTGYYRDGELYPSDNGLTGVIAKDIREISVAELRGFDAVLHLAELSNDPLGQLSPEVTFKLNHQGSVQLARRCKEAGIERFVYTSSCSVYGAGSGETKTEESAPLPQTAYAECKVLVERDVSALADDDFSPTFLRNATAYGGSPRMRFDIVLNNLAGHAWTRGVIQMTSDGSPWRPLVHVLDICEALACTLEAPREAVHGKIFNVGRNEENYRVREIAEIVAAAFPGCELAFGSSDGDNRSYRVSFDRIHRELPGFRCQRTAAEGAAELREVFERVRLSQEDFESRHFTRLKQLRHLLDSGRLDREFFWTSTAPLHAANVA